MLSFALLSLMSPLLPTGGFTWSQGLEKAVEDNLVTNEHTLETWVKDSVERGLVFTELPLLLRFYNVATHFLMAGSDDQILEEPSQKLVEPALLDQMAPTAQFLFLMQLSLAVRPTLELRLEEREKGRALLGILPSLGVKVPKFLTTDKSAGYLAVLGVAAVAMQVKLDDLLRAFVFTYTESAVMAGAKTLPLGQNAAWRIIRNITAEADNYPIQAQAVSDEEIGAGLVGFAIESARHETMYSRIYRN